MSAMQMQPSLAARRIASGTRGGGGIAKAVEFLDVGFGDDMGEVTPVFRAGASYGDSATHRVGRTNAGGDFVFCVVGVEANTKALDGAITAEIILPKQSKVVVFGVEFVVGLFHVTAQRGFHRRHARGQCF